MLGPVYARVSHRDQDTAKLGETYHSWDDHADKPSGDGNGRAILGRAVYIMCGPEGAERLSGNAREVAIGACESDLICQTTSMLAVAVPGAGAAPAVGALPGASGAPAPWVAVASFKLPETATTSWLSAGVRHTMTNHDETRHPRRGESRERAQERALPLCRPAKATQVYWRSVTSEYVSTRMRRPFLMSKMEICKAATHSTFQRRDKRIQVLLYRAIQQTWGSPSPSCTASQTASSLRSWLTAMAVIERNLSSISHSVIFVDMV